MKKFVIVALLAIPIIRVSAQVIYSDDRDDFQNNLKMTAKYHKHLADNHILDTKEYAYSRKHPEGILRLEVKYDSRGNIIENTIYTKHGKIKYHSKWQYNDNNRMLSSVDLSKKGTSRSGAFWDYDKSGNVTRLRSWWKDTAHITYSYTTEYNPQNNPVQTKIYYSKHKLYSTAVYEYYDDGSKKKTTTYNSKEKVTGIWNYDCNPIGQSQESKMKDTNKICVHYETDKNGNQVKVKEEYTEGGKLFKYRLRKISKYDKNNQLIEQITMKMNGKEIWHSSANYNADGNLTEWYQYAANSTTLKKHWVYTYNTSGDIIQATVYSKASPAGAVIKYVYN